MLGRMGVDNGVESIKYDPIRGTSRHCWRGKNRAASILDSELLQAAFKRAFSSFLVRQVANFRSSTRTNEFVYTVGKFDGTLIRRIREEEGERS